MKFNLYEKSFRKSEFLKDVSNKLGLNTEIFQKDIFKERNLKTDLIVTRAFKPLPIILDLVYKNFQNFKNVILFLGKNRKDLLKESLMKWKFEYKEKMSLTSDESIILKIYNLKKK